MRQTTFLWAGQRRRTEARVTRERLQGMVASSRGDAASVAHAQEAELNQHRHYTFGLTQEEIGLIAGVHGERT
jgi:uncharacterized protein YfiM (DUF2279 family)